jgi:hypothetical protein
MSGFQREVRTTPRTQEEINAERNDDRRSAGVAAFVDATNSPDGGAYGYQTMLEHLFQAFESDHGTGPAINTVLEALKPVLRRHHDVANVYARFDQVIDEVEASKKI